MRSHASWYLKGLPKNGEIRNQLMQTTTVEAFKQCIDTYRKEVM